MENANGGISRIRGEAEPVRLAARHFYPVTQPDQYFRDLFAVAALYFDHAFFHRPANAAGLLDLLRQRGHFIFAKNEIFDERHALAAAPFGGAVQVGGLLIRRQRLGGRFSLLLLAEIALFGGPDGARIGHGRIVMQKNGGCYAASLCMLGGAISAGA